MKFRRNIQLHKPRKCKEKKGNGQKKEIEKENRQSSWLPSQELSLSPSKTVSDANLLCLQLILRHLLTRSSRKDLCMQHLIRRASEHDNLTSKLSVVWKPPRSLAFPLPFPSLIELSGCSPICLSQLFVSRLFCDCLLIVF